MSRADHPGAGAVSLDQLVALNDEMAALVRAGIPLEKGLVALGRDLPGKPGVLATQLGQRLGAGEALADILARDAATYPPVWRAVVLAGLRSGHLAAALESLSETGRRAAELRRAITISLVYPLMVAAVGFLTILFTLTAILPRLRAAFEDLTSSTDSLLVALTWLGSQAVWWGPTLPILAIAILVTWRYRSGRAMTALRNGAGRSLVGWPTVGRSVRNGRLATFAELFALLHKHEVPLSEAVVLAAEASGDRPLTDASRELAERLNRGEPVRRREDLPAAFPPLLGWSILSGAGQAALNRTLITSATLYRQRASWAVRWADLYLPIFLSVMIGGSVVLFQALIIFWPFSRILFKLGNPF